ncbi:MAG: Holliday junction branch migration protein RuvA [Spirochaetaceae bacterium]|nr:Holliday junction branch migration protein RuvA [Spirochaetaceae bacterium]
MFNRIRGILGGYTEESLYVSTGAIEWEIAVPLRDASLHARIGEELELYTWLHHYEDGMRLYGFMSSAERKLFLDLQKVEGIGPRQAFKVLQGVEPQTLIALLEHGDLAALQKIPGIGPKTAQKMMLALKGKLMIEDGEGSRGIERMQTSRWNDVIRALVDMGFDRRETEKVVLALGSGIEDDPQAEKELFRKALLELSAASGA